MSFKDIHKNTQKKCIKACHNYQEKQQKLKMI